MSNISNHYTIIENKDGKLTCENEKDKADIIELEIPQEFKDDVKSGDTLFKHYSENMNKTGMKITRDKELIIENMGFGWKRDVVLEAEKNFAAYKEAAKKANETNAPTERYSNLSVELTRKAGVSGPVKETNSNTDFGSYEFRNISGMLEDFSKVTAKEVSKGKNREDKDVYVVEFDNRMGPQGVVINDLGFEPKPGMQVIHDGDSGIGGDKTVSFYDKEGSLLFMAEQHNAGDWKKLDSEEIKKYIPTYTSGSEMENKPEEISKKEPQTDKEIILDILEQKKNVPIFEKDPNYKEANKAFDELIKKHINLLSNEKICNSKNLGFESCSSQDLSLDILKNRVKTVQQSIVAEQASKKNR